MTTKLQHTSGLILSGDGARCGLHESAHPRAAQRGELVRVRRGVYCDSQEWQALTPRDRHVLRMRAVAASGSQRLVFCGYSAAAVWGMPVAGPWPENVHIVASSSLKQRSRYGVVRHPVADTVDRVVERDGLFVTDVARTALDLVLASPFAHAVGSADWALWRNNSLRVGKAEIQGELERVNPRYRRRHAEAVLEFATDLSDSFGESLARGVMRELGFETPELQVVFGDRAGDMIVDYYWPSVNVAGEFDGKSKYLRPSFQVELDPGERVWREKKREDRLRRQVAGVVRIIWSDLSHGADLARLLTEAGIPRRGDARR
ncbi:MAG: type IV toxin-antitoxin system AbiEi family antitoxin domain-containing protein [Cryobacterium sp.]|nr:type IV toxin-antitoxin system AbiEi family antitoxin domain-containing protein [Cryobacterium sp.]